MIFGGFIRFTHLLIRQRALIWSMAKREISNQYVGSFLGLAWAFIQPAVMLTVFWFIFSIGFRVTPKNDVPFVVWLAAGMAPWFYFTSIITSSTGAVVQHAHLIKKTVFPSQILPVVKIFSNLVGHAAFVSVLFLLILANSLEVNIFYFQMLYFFICLCTLALGIGYLVSALHVFARDVGHIVGVLVQVGFWGTPIFWDINIMPERLQPLIKLNPAYYIVQGYRDSFIYFVPFWERIELGIYFWIVSGFLLILGAYVFRKLKPQFADVL